MKDVETKSKAHRNPSLLPGGLGAASPWIGGNGCSPELAVKAATTSSLWADGVERALENEDMGRLGSLHAAQERLWALPSIKGDLLLVQVLEE